MGWQARKSAKRAVETADAERSAVVEYAQKLVDATIAEIDRADTKAALFLAASVEQRSQADQLASRIAGLGELAVAAGNWNWGRADTIPATALDFAPLHLRPARMRYTPQDRTLTPNYDVHDVLASIGMEDAAVLTPGQRNSSDLGPAGTSSRVDRIYLTWDLADAAARCARQDIGDSEHQALMLTLDGLRAARTIPPEPRQ